MDKLEDLNVYGKYKSGQFVSAWIRLKRTKGYDHNHFVTNFLDHYNEDIPGRSGEKMIYDGLVRIYNFNKRGKSRII